MPSLQSGGGTDEISLPSGGDNEAAGGSGSSGAAGGIESGGATGDGSGGVAGGTGVEGGAQVQAQKGNNTDNAINVEDDAGHIDGDGPPAKR